MSARRSSGARRVGALLLACVLGLGALATTSAPATAAPRITATTVVSGLTIPWDITWIGDLMLYNERAGRIWSKRGNAAANRVTVPLPPIFASSEGGLLGMVAHPQAATNGLFYTCQDVERATIRDVQVLRWRLTTDTTAVSDGNPIVTGAPVTSGRHSGCRLRFGTDGKLYVGTGDAAEGVNPQNLASLGGKVLRVNDDGTIPGDNPFVDRGGNARYVWTYGHRNLQGLTVRPGTGEIWSAEHGPARDDEVNRIVRGANYGWDPVPGYTESVPMTDPVKFPDARPAMWSSGSPTVATSGATFLSGPAWGRFQGALAVALLKDQGILIMSLNPAGQVARVERLPVADNDERIRTVQQGPDGALYYTTADGGGSDRIVRLAASPTIPAPAYRPGLDVSPVGVSAARTGSTWYLFVRSSGDRVYFKRSTTDGQTWGGWVNTGVVSRSAPSVTSSAPGRIDLMTRSTAGDDVIHTWFVNGVRTGQRNLGGNVTTAPAVSSVGDGTLDVFARGTSNSGHRKHYAGGVWSAWQNLGGLFTSALGASANLTTKNTVVTGRGTNGQAYERTVTPTGNGTGWTSTGQSLWTARALGDTSGSQGRVGVSSGSDAHAVLDRGSLVQGIVSLYNSAPDVVTRSDGTWIMFGRSSNGSVWMYDARPGGYRNVDLGGYVR